MVKVKSVKKHEKKETETTDVQKPALVIKKPKKPPDYLENGLLVGEAQNGSGSGVEETPDEPMNGPVDLAKPMDLTHAAEEPMHIDPKPSVSPVPLPNNAESPPTEAPPTSGTTPPEPPPSPPGQNGGLSRSPRSDPLPVLDTNGDISHESRDDSRDAESRDRPESRDMSRSESHDMSRSESQDSCSQEVEGAPLWNNSLSSLEQLLNQAPTHQQQELQKAGHFPPAFRGPRIPTASGFICDKCGFVSKSQAGVNKHKGRVHSDKNEKFVAAHPYKCNICEFRAKRVKQVREHVAVHGVQCCMYCLFAGTRDEIERHVLADHASRPVKTCHVCSKSMDMDDHQYQEHVTSCDGHKLIFQCELCPRAFNFKNDLKLHEQSHETEKVKRFACDDCDYQTAYRANLMKHIEHKHQTVKPKLTCPICQKLYHNDMALKRHVKTHSEKPGHVCDQCEKVFEGVRGLKEHLREVHNCYMYKCEVVGCDKTFKSRKAVRNHCAEFHGMADKKYRCDYEGCTMEFFRSSHLSRHKRTHSDEREFKCTWPECGKAFRHADNLKVHYRKHTNDKCFKCPECEYTCTQKHVLNGHVRRHHQPGSTESFIGDYEYADSEEDTDETLILADVLDSSFNDSTLMQFAEEFMSHWDNEKIDRHYPGLEEVFDNLDTIDLDSFVWEAEEIDETLAILTLDGIRKRKRGRPRLEEIGAVSATVRRKRSQNKDWSEDQPRQKRQQKRFLDPDRLRSEPRKQDPSVYDFNSDDEGNHLMQHQHHQQQQQQQHMYNQQQQQNMMMHHYNNYNNTMSGGKMQHMMPHQQQPPPNQAMGGMEQMNAQLSEQMNSQMPDQMAQHGKLLSQALTRPLDQMSNMAMQPMPGYSGPVSEPQDIASNIPPIMPEVQTSCPSSLPDAGGMFDPGHATSDLFGEHKPEKNEIIDQHLLQKYLEDTSMEDFERDLIKNEKPNKTGEFDQYMGTEAPAPIEAPGSISSGGHSADHWKNHDPKSNDISSVHSWSDKQEHTDTPVHYDQSIIPQSPMVSKPSDYQPPSVQSDHQPSDYNPNLPTYDHGGIPTLPTYSGPDSRPDNREPVFGQSTNYHTPTPPICSSANDSAAYNNPLQLAPTSRPLENPLSSLAMSTAKYLESEMSKTRVYSNQGWTLQETQSLRLTHSLLGRGQEWPPTPDSGTSYPYLSDRDPYSASTANRVPPYFPGELEKPCPGSDYDRYDMARYLNPGLPSQPPGFNPYDRLGASKPYEPGFRQPMDYRQALPTPPDIYATMADKYSFYSRPDPYSPRVADNPFLAGQPVQPGFPAGRDYARDYREYPRAPVYPQPGGYPTLMESAAKYPEPGPDFFMPGRPAPPVQDPYRPMVYNMMNRYYQ